MRPTEDSDPGSSCSSVITSSLVNGSESQYLHTDHTSEMMGKTDGSSSDTLIEKSKYRLKSKWNKFIYDILNNVQKLFMLQILS